MKRSIGRLVVLLLAVSGCGTYHLGGDAGIGDDAGATGGGGGDDMGGVVVTGDGGVVPQRACATTFTYHGASPAKVAVAGEFNSWDTTKNPLTGPDANGDWTAKVDLPPGAYAYKIVTTDGSNMQTWIEDPQNPYTKWVGGVENSVVEVDDCKAPLLQYKTLTKTPDGTLHAEVQYLDGSAAAGLDVNSVSVLLDGQPAGGAKLDGNGLITVDVTGLAKTKHRLVFSAKDQSGAAATDLHVPFWIEDQPFHFTDGLMYFPFTDRFRNGDPSNDNPTAGVDARANYQGGDWAGIEQSIKDGYFDALGVRTIWLSPPNKNPDGGFVGTGGHLYTGYHGYWPSAGRDVQPRFGTLDELKSLVKTAHAHGIRVIVDSVLNHVHQESPYWQMHQNDGWFNPLSINGTSCQCHSGGNDCGDWDSSQPVGYHSFLPRFTCWFEGYMPDFDYTNWDALTTSIDDALFWAREVDVDGFRVDAVKHFLLTATTRLRGKLHDQFEWTGDPLFYLVGETYTGDRGLINSFIGPHALDAQFDFAIYFSIINTLATYSSSLRELESATAASDQAFGTAPMSPFLGNHDTSRFLSIANGDGYNDPWNNAPQTPTVEDPYFKLRLALTFVATSPGVPMIYYGDEYGQPGAGDPDNRRFMKLDHTGAPFEATTLDLVKKLGAARKELVALQRGTRRTLWIDDNHYVYARVSDQKVAIVVLNRDFAAPFQQMVPIPADLPLPDGTVLTDRLGGASVTAANKNLPINVAAHTSAVYAP